MSENLQTIDTLDPTPFKHFITTIGALPTSFTDSMSYYELLAWFCDYLQNTVIPAINNNAQAVEELQALYIELHDYVENYFDNLDVQEEINKKLDEMAEDGSLTALIKAYIDPLIEAQNVIIEAQGETIAGHTTAINSLNGDLALETSNRTDADAQLQTQISTIVASAGTAGESSSEIVQARTNTANITFPALDDRIDYIENTTPFGSQAVNNANLNSLVTPKTYLVYGTVTNAPTLKTLNFSSITATVIVEGYNPTRDGTTGEITKYQALEQRYYPQYNAGLSQFRGFFVRQVLWSNTDNNYRFGVWSCCPSSFVESLFNADNKIVRASLSDNYASNGAVSAATDLNTLTAQGNYILTSSENTNTPTGLSVGFLSNENLVASGNTWLKQTFSTQTGDQVWERICFIRTTNPIYNEWKKIYPVEAGNTSLAGKKIVNFGDSIFGNFRDTTSVSSNIADITGATVYNVGFGGCQMSDRSDNGWKAFSMCNLATAVASQDFTTQDDAIANPPTGMPAYFATHLATLKSIDFSTVDIVTIAYGTNDYTAGDSLDNSSNLKDISTFAGALRYSIETLLTAYPNLKIVIGTPIFRLWLNGTTVEYTSDTRTYAGDFTLIDMTEKVKDVGEEYHCQVIDAYNDFGVNQYNWERIFDSTDTTHPNAAGRALLGRLYGVELLK